MHIPQFTPNAIDGGPAETFEDIEAARRADEMVRAAVEDLTEGVALLRGAAILLAYLAAHQDDPEQSLAEAISEQSVNAHRCLIAMQSMPAGSA